MEDRDKEIVDELASSAQKITDELVKNSVDNNQDPLTHALCNTPITIKIRTPWQNEKKINQ